MDMVWSEHGETIKGTIIDYFQEIFMSIHSNEPSSLVGRLERWVMEEMNQQLLVDISGEEVRTALFQMYPNKALGHNGMSPFFSIT